MLAAITTVAVLAIIVATTTTTATSVQAVVEDDGELVLPYCDTPEGKAAPSCHDRYDFYESGPKSGLYPCNDGSEREDPKDCPDATESKSNDEDSNSNDEDSNSNDEDKIGKNATSTADQIQRYQNVLTV